MGQDQPKVSRAERVRYVLRSPFEAALAVVGVLGGIAYLISPAVFAQASVGISLGSLLPVWTAMFAIGSLAVLVGLVALNPRLELAGLSLFSAALLVEAVAIFDVHSLLGVVSELEFLALALAPVGRAYTILLIIRAAEKLQEPAE